jgi:hypothetical protein
MVILSIANRAERTISMPVSSSHSPLSRVRVLEGDPGLVESSQ